MNIFMVSVIVKARYRLSITPVAAFLMVSSSAAQPALSGSASSTTPAITAAQGTGALTPAIQEIIISGSPSLLRVANPWPLFGSLERPCATFRVSAAAAITSVDLYTSGLARTVLAEIDSDQASKCPAAKSWSERITLAQDKSGAAVNKLVAIKIDPDPLSTAGASMQGSVIALTGTKKAAEFVVKVERPPGAEVWTAVPWVLSILIPGTITYWFTQRTSKSTARHNEDDEFRAFRLENMVKIREFLLSVDAVVRSTQDHPGETVLRIASERGMFAKMPRRESRPLYDACFADNLAGIIESLNVLFPEHKNSLSRLEASLQEKKRQTDHTENHL